MIERGRAAVRADRLSAILSGIEVPSMPVYEYYCSTCRTRFEELVRVTGKGERATCPSCARADVPRVLSTFATVRGGSDGAELAAAAGGCGGCGPSGCGCH
jgi:putative FmdB family regulatory protein